MAESTEKNSVDEKLFYKMMWKRLRFHVVALFTIAIWGTTFVSTKILMLEGLAPLDIFLYRCIIAYIGIATIAPKIAFAHSFKDEFLLMVVGFCGGSLYFTAENFALQYTYVSNVSLIVCIAPLVTGLLVMLLRPKNQMRKSYFFIGTIIAFCGVALVVFNGQINFNLSPIGDILTVIASIAWAVYCFVIENLQQRYNTLFITRKVFFYGLVTLLPFMVWIPPQLTFHLLLKPVVIGHLLFLALLASMVCFLTWNVAVKGLGSVVTTHYVYFVPIVAMITSFFVLDEPINDLMILGVVLTLGGVFIGNRQ